jgi:general secretion pathway protein C
MAALFALRKVTTSVVWAACAASAVAWGLRLSGTTMAVPANAQLLAPEQSSRGDPLRLFSLPPAPTQAGAPPQASRFKLVGVMAPLDAGAASPGAKGKAAALGVALLSTDGKPARAFRVGAAVDGDWVLQAVSQRGAQLGPQGAGVALQLELPALPPAATGSLRGADNAAPGGAVAAPPAVQVVPGGLPAAMPVPPTPPQASADVAPVDSLRAEAGVSPPDGRFGNRKGASSAR